LVGIGGLERRGHSYLKCKLALGERGGREGRPACIKFLSQKYREKGSLIRRGKRGVGILGEWVGRGKKGSKKKSYGFIKGRPPVEGKKAEGCRNKKIPRGGYESSEARQLRKEGSGRIGMLNTC